MKNILLMFLPTVILLGGMFIVLFPALWLYRWKNSGRRSPLSRELLRSPGESLREQIEEISYDIDTVMVASFTLPALSYASFVSQLYFTNVKNPVQVFIFYLIITLLLTAFLIFRLSKKLTRRNELRLGLDAELAIGQELNQLMLNGYRVFHDFPADNFNIDHIVFGPDGVFAVETKGRAKPVKSDTKREWKVTFDGQALLFPNWTEREFLPQARRQAEWLAKWLSSAVGEQVQVRPVLALPGWYIDRLKPSDVYLFNGKNPLAWAGKKLEAPLSDSLIQRIAHQIEQKCRDVEPSAYKKEKKSN